MNAPRTIYHDCAGSALAAAVARLLALDLVSALEKREKVVFLASGGRSPGAVLIELSQADLDWSRVIVSLTDDRRVPPNHAHSNARLVTETLLRGRAAAARLVPLWLPNDKKTATALLRLERTLGNLAPFDVALLGMGMDGHTASIFPAGSGMQEARTSTNAFAATAPEPLPPEAPWPRITATLGTLSAVPALHLMLFGTEKKALFDRLTEDPDATAPAATLAAAAMHRFVVHTSP